MSLLLRANPIEGDASDRNEWPWLVFLNFGRTKNLKASLMCTGALISPNYVLTAAHCLKDEHHVKWPNKTHVWLGAHDRREKETTVKYVKAEEIIIHPKYYTPTKLNYDVALIRLAETVTMTKKYRTLCLPEQEHDYTMSSVDAFGDVAAWSLYDENPRESYKLLDAKFPVVSKTDCWESLKSKSAENSDTQLSVTITENMFCAGYVDDGHATCAGASGAPMVMQKSGTDDYFGVGLVSFGISNGDGQCGNVVTYTVFAELNKEIVTWIKSNANNLQEIE